MVQLSKAQIKKLQKNHTINNSEPIIIPNVTKIISPISDLKPTIEIPSDAGEIKPVFSPIVYSKNISIINPVIKSVVSSINTPFILPVSVPIYYKIN